MCGIIGYAANENIGNMLIESLKKLEYRGYDSAGIAYFNNQKIKIFKNKGSVEKVFSHLLYSTFNVGIGHTRWATHGKVNKKNSHPHTSQNSQVVIVHNGIIENYIYIKKKYLPNTKTVSETDTEIVANLIEYFYKITNDKLESILSATKILKGSYSLLIMFNDDENNIYFAKNKSPLLIGLGNKINSISSDILGFDKKIKRIIELYDNQYGYFNKSDIHIFKNKKEVSPKTNNINTYIPENNIGQFSHYMLKEIFEIPAVVKNIAYQYCKISPFEKFNLKYFKDINRIRFIACGTSFHASQIGEKMLSKIGFDTTTEIASEFISHKQNINNNTLFIFLSQSGETADTISSLKLAKKQNAKTLCITNVETSTLAKLSDYVLPLHCGPEVAVASTKAFNAQIVILLYFCEYLRLINTDNISKIDENIKKISKKLINFTKKIKITDFKNQIIPLIDIVKKSKTIFMIGKNFDYVLAQESSLKLKEISYINVCCLPSGELKHGTISLISKNSLTFAFATEKPLMDKTINAIKQIKARKGKVVLVSQFQNTISDIDYKVLLPKVYNNFYSLISIIPMQLLAYYTSISLGHNPDRPRNLAKSVTVE